MDASEYMDKSLEIIKATYDCSRRSANALERISVALEWIIRPDTESDELLALRNENHQLRAKLYAIGNAVDEAVAPV